MRGPGSDAALASILALPDGDESKSLAAEVWGHMSRTGDVYSDAFCSCFQDLGLDIRL